MRVGPHRPVPDPLRLDLHVVHTPTLPVRPLPELRGMGDRYRLRSIRSDDARGSRRAAEGRAPMTLIERDMLMIGAGPVGLYAAYYAGFRGLSTAIVESLPESGGQGTAHLP